MSYGIASDEVAEDYRKALEDLTMNSRYEISNLTVIAKENTEHALAIAEAVKSHIMQTSPQKKLPAFYVLDSVVKNVGTPYTLFFGRQLYKTFMEAYALVDNSVRRKMEEMLKTWKEPVPGSMDTRPVFPPDVTRPIENALIKARTSAMLAQQEQLRTQQQYLGRGRPVASSAPYQQQMPNPPASYRPTPVQSYPPNYPSQQYQSTPVTPAYANQPQTHPQQYSAPVNAQYQSPPPNPQYPAPPVTQAYSTQPTYPQHGLPPRPPTQQYNQYSSPVPGWQPPAPQVNHALEETIALLNRDIEKLITTAKAEWALNEYDTEVHKRLNALLDLQTILQTQTLPTDQIMLIKEQVAQLSASAQPLRLPSPAPVPVKAPQQPTLSSILGPGALQALLARHSAAPQPMPPAPVSAPIRSPQPNYSLSPYQPPPAILASAAPTVPLPDPNSLLERLRAAGMLPQIPATSTPPVQNATIKNTGFPPPLPFISTPPTSRVPLANIPNDAVLKPASLKIPRPHLISGLYEQLGVPCTQCGRRFQTDEQGKKKKAAHMDWHFRVRQRMEEAETKGQHRSWYVDELDWIRTRETSSDALSSPNSLTNGTTTISSTSAQISKDPKTQYLPVPDDPAMANSVCPICQEKFEMKWLDEAQEFVWMDAKRVGARIYHASCHEEAMKEAVGRGTPEPAAVAVGTAAAVNGAVGGVGLGGSSLGKRKAEDEGDDIGAMSLRTRVKVEGVA